MCGCRKSFCKQASYANTRIASPIGELRPHITFVEWQFQKVKEMNAMNNDLLLSAALDYAKRGFSVLPLHSPIFDEDAVRCSCGNTSEDHRKHIGKHPRTPHGFKDATTDAEKIRRWWTDYPDANIGIATGKVSGIWVADYDPRSSEGERSYIERFGPQSTPHTLTGGLGGHFLYAYHDDLPKGGIKGIDIKSDGGYIVAPPSRHFSGRVYEWQVDLDTPLADVPVHLLDVIKNARRGAGYLAPAHIRPVHPYTYWVRWAIEKRLPFHGEVRRNAFFDLACQLRDNRYPSDECEAAVEAYCVAVTDLKDHPFDVEQATQILDDVMTREPRDPVVARDGGRPLTDLAVAERFAIDYGERFLHCPEFGHWLVWDGVVWRDGRAEEVWEAAFQLVRRIRAEAVRSKKNDEQAEEKKYDPVKGANLLQRKSRIEAILALAGQMLTRHQHDLDGDDSRYLLSVENGTVDLKTGKLLPHVPGRYITKSCPVTFDAEATCPQWGSFLDRVFAGNQELITYLQKVVGYSMLGITSEHVLFILYGSGRNGKTTVVETIRAMLGDYAQQLPEGVLTKSDGFARKAENAVARLRAARFVTATELEEGERLAPATVKLLTGGDRLVGRFLYREHFEFEPQAAFWISTNYRPHADADDMALWERIRLIPFSVTIPAEERDPYLRGRLLKELPGILNWAIQGCLAFQREGLKTPKAVDEASSEYRDEEDILACFVEECFDHSEAEYKNPNDEVWKAYGDWCDFNDERKLARNTFFKRMRERGFESRKSGSTRYLIGSKLTPKDTSVGF